MKALLVEDDSDLRLLIEEVLTSRGYQPVSFDNGQTAWASCHDTSYHLALIGRNVPGIDGLDLCRRVRDLPWGSQVVVLIITARRSAADLEEILDVGADDYVARPISPEHLHVRLAVAEHSLQMRLAQLLAAEELRHERNFIAAVLQTSGALVQVLDRKGRIVRFNRQCERLSGYTAAEVRGRPARDLLVDAAQRERVTEIYRRLRSGDSPCEYEGLLVARDGTQHLIHWSNTVLLDQAGKVEYIISTGIDISRRQELERKITQAKREWERTFDTVPELIALIDTEHRIVRVNRAMASLLGLRPQELVGRTWFSALHGSDRPPDGCITTALHELRELSGEAYFERLGRNYLLSVTPLADPGNGRRRAVFVARDLTQRERAEELANRQTMIAQIEEIFSAFRHEMGNAINTLRTTLDVLRANFDAFNHLKRLEYLARCHDTVKVTERLLKMIKHYQEYDRLDLAPLSLGTLLQRQRPVLRDLAAAHRVNCVLRLPPSQMMIDGNEAAVLQVLLNLLNNAIAATAGSSDPRIVITCRSSPGWHTLSVADNGTGIAAEHLPRVFTPFFTTAQDGSGLGLAIVHKLMTQMGGEVTIRSEVDLGTTAELRFPEKQKDPSESHRPGGREG